MSNKITTSFFLIFGLLLFSFPTEQTFAYNEETTHPALTDEIVDFYNLLHPDKSLTNEQKEWLVAGSILEDTPPRWINHFYDPVRKTGWVGEKAGELPSSLVRGLSLVGLSPEGALSTLNWVHNGAIQSQYSRYGGNRTWEQALNYFINKNEKEAYITLGHILHLLEDMSVPDHTRNDTHAPLEAVGDDGSPFEDYLQKWTRKTIKQLNIAGGLKAKGISAPQFSSVDSYLSSLAEYSNQYFFSKDTINDPKYSSPKISREDENFGYGLDENNNEFPLVKVRKRLNEENQNIDIIYEIIKKPSYYPILDSYFSRLAPKTVAYGVGVLELFFKQIPDAEIAKEFPSQLVKYDFSHVTPPSISLVGEGSKIVNATKLFVSSFVYIAQNGMATVSGFANKRFKRTEENIETLKTAITEPVNLLASNINKLDQTQNQNQTPAKPPTQNQSPTTIAEIQNKLEIAKNDFQKTLSNLQASALGNALNLPAENSLANVNTNTNTNTNQTQNVSGGSSYSYGGGSPPVNTASTANTASTVNTVTTTTSTATSTDSNTNNSTSTTTATSTDSTATSTSPLIVISEIQVSGADSGDEFIELYNYGTSTIDISSWSIQYLGGASANVAKKNFESGNQISPKSFFLIARNKNASSTDGYTGVKTADMSHRTFSLSGESTGGKIFLVKNNETIANENDTDIVDKLDYSFSVPPANQSLERKSLQNSQCASAQNSGEFLGNGCDTNNNSDWETRTTPNPQNSQSLAESRTAPSVSNFTGIWQSASSTVNLSWDTAANIFYTLKELVTNTWNTLLSATTTNNYQKSITERGKDYSFSLTASDTDNLNSASSTIIVAVPVSQSPSAPTDITFSYASSSAELTFSWLPSTDADTADNLLSYETKINSGVWASTTLISGENPARKYSKISATANTTYNIELKAKDELNNYSSSTAASYTTPAAFIPANISIAINLSYANKFNGYVNDCNDTAFNVWKDPVGFTVNQTFNVSAINVGLYHKQASGSGPINVGLRLYKDNSSTLYASTNSIKEDEGSGNVGGRIYSFSTPVLLTSSTQYYLDTSRWQTPGGAWATHDGTEFITCNKSTTFTFNGSSTTP